MTALPHGKRSGAACEKGLPHVIERRSVGEADALEAGTRIPQIGPGSDRHRYPPDRWTIPLGTGVFDPVHRVLISADRKIFLSPRESDALFCIATRATLACSPQMLALDVWGRAGAAETSACRQVLSSLRGKVEKLGAAVSLINVHGAGYRLLAVHPNPDREIDDWHG